MASRYHCRWLQHTTRILLQFVRMILNLNWAMMRPEKLMQQVPSFYLSEMRNLVWKIRLLLQEHRTIIQLKLLLKLPCIARIRRFLILIIVRAETEVWHGQEMSRMLNLSSTVRTSLIVIMSLILISLWMLTMFSRLTWQRLMCLTNCVLFSLWLQEEMWMMLQHGISFFSWPSVLVLRRK